MTAYLKANKGKILSVLAAAAFAGAGLYSGEFDAATALAKFVALAGLAG